MLTIDHMNMPSKGDVEPAQHVDRSGEVLLVNRRSDSGDEPFILAVQIISETANEVVFDVQYFLSETAMGLYNISIHPDTSDWAYTSNTMHSGLHREIISVSFNPQPSTKTKSVSHFLHIYINHALDNQWVGKVFDRTVPFPKMWTY